jgi:exopolysaccharide biosynthesis polyprenyl glycosylphosphotransferase
LGDGGTLSTTLHESTIDSAAPIGLEQPLLAPREGFRLNRTVAFGIAGFGRYGCAWLPAYALLVHQKQSVAPAVALASVVAAVWTLALVRAFAAARLTLLSLGPAPAAALGTATGGIFVSALSGWSGAGLSFGIVLEMAVAVFVFSALWEGLVHRSLAGQRRVLVVGAGDGGAELVQELALGDTGPFEAIGLVDDEYEAEQIAGTPVHGRISDLSHVVATQQPDIVVLAVGDSRPEAFERLLDVAGVGFKVVGLPEFHEHAFGRVPVRTLTPAWFMNVLHLYQRPYTRLAKRALDIGIALFGLLLTGWLFPLLAYVVRRTPGPVIFRQTRLGEGGAHFTIYKFRTMRADAEASGAMWAAERDPRITRSGAFMRKTRLDELPQLWNVLRGDMSIVGPRPERPEFVDQLQEAVPFWSRRHLVKPGITGWAQVRRGYTADAEGTADKLSYDLWYLRHRSVLLDLAICVKTFSTLVSGSGAR